MTIKELLHQIDELIRKSHPEIELNEIVHNWSELYELYNSNKNLSVRQIMKIKKKFKIGYNITIEFGYSKKLEIINNFSYLNNLINENVSCRKINKNSKFSTLNSFLISSIFSFLKVLELEDISKVNRMFFSLYLKNIFSNKFFASIKIPDLSSGLKISEKPFVFDIINLFTDGKHDYVVMKSIDEKDTYELCIIENDNKKLILTFHSLGNTFLDNCLYIFDFNTDKKEIETIKENSFLIKKVYLYAPFYFQFYHNYSNSELIAVDYTGSIFSIDKCKGSVSKIFNKKDYEIMTNYPSRLQYRVTCYCYKDKLLIYTNSLNIFDLKCRRVTKKIQVNKIEQFDDSLIEEGLLIAKLRNNNNKLMLFDIDSLIFIKTYEKSILNQEINFTFFKQNFRYGEGIIINNILERRLCDKQQKNISIKGNNLLNHSSKYDFLNGKILITNTSNLSYISFNVPKEINYIEFMKHDLYEKFSEDIVYESLKSLDLTIFTFYDIKSKKISAKMNYPEEKVFFNKKGKFILISDNNYSLELYDESFSLKSSITQESILLSECVWKFFDSHFVGVDINNLNNVYIWNISTDSIKKTNFPDLIHQNSTINYTDKFILVLSENEVRCIKKFLFINDDITLLENIILPNSENSILFIDILDNSDVLTCQTNYYSIYRKKGENYENIVKMDTLSYFKSKMREGVYLLDGYNCMVDINFEIHH